jgi:hypothetical protein
MPREQIDGPKKKKGNPLIASYAKAAGTQWKPGQSGNIKGRTPAKLITDALKGIYDNPENLKKFVLAAHKRALKGNPKFWEMIADRLEGKVLQQIEHTGNIIHEITNLEREMAKGSLQKIRALQSDNENPLLAEVVGPSEEK